MLKQLNNRYILDEFLDITHIDMNTKNNIVVLHLTDNKEIKLNGVTKNDIKKFFKVK